MLTRAGGILGPFSLIFIGFTTYCIYVAVTERKNYIRIKKFLEDYKALKPARYSYADIKRITNQFKNWGREHMDMSSKESYQTKSRLLLRSYKTLQQGMAKSSSMKWKQCVKFTTSMWLAWLAFVQMGSDELWCMSFYHKVHCKDSYHLQTPRMSFWVGKGYRTLLLA